MQLVADNHCDYVNSLHSPITRILHKTFFRYYVVNKLIPHVKLFYGVTPSRCTFLKEVYGVPDDRIKLLVMGADDRSMRLEKRLQLRKEVRGRYGIKDDDFLIVTGGKIDRLKNIHILANAVNSIQNEHVKLLVFGKINEDMQPIFDAEDSQRIIRIGWVNSDKVYELFYAADLIVFPGLHSVLWEQAVASKTPCAFSKMKGFEHVNINGNCILMEGKDSLFYQNMISELLESPQSYLALKDSCEDPQIEAFYYSNIARQVINDVYS